jgi:hypothetical protein
VYKLLFENVFENDELSMSHLTIVGKADSGKTELIKQIVGSFLQGGKRILWLDSIAENDWMFKKWNGYRISEKEELKKGIFSTHKLIALETTDINFDELRDVLVEEGSQWVLVHDNMDELVINYDQNEFSTQKLDFLYYVSEFGRVFNLYTMIAGKDLKHLSKVHASKKIIENSKNLVLLEQDYQSLKFAKKQNWLNEEQIEQVKNLPKYEAFYLRKSI